MFKKLIPLLLIVVVMAYAEEETVTFSPPPGWQLAELKGLPKSIKAMVVGKGKNEYPPSMNLAVEPWDKTLKDYIKLAKGLSEAKGADFKDLGFIQTQAGNAALIQEDSRTRWGEEKQMHLLLLKNGNVYILTAASLKEEFPKFYKDFFDSMRSLRISKGVFETISDPQKREELEEATRKLNLNFQNLVSKKQSENPSETKRGAIQTVFESQTFQTEYWVPFQRFLESEYADFGKEWQQLLIAQVQTSLLMTP